MLCLGCLGVHVVNNNNTMDAKQLRCNDIKASLTYVKQGSFGPCLQCGAEVVIENARLLEERLSMMVNGVELILYPTVLTTDQIHSDEEMIQSVYYPEVCDVVKRLTGAGIVLAFHHQIRAGDQPRRSDSFTGEAAMSNQPEASGYHSMVHCDYTPASAAATFQWQLSLLSNLGEDQAKYANGRFMLVNAWRNIREKDPILNNHLAVCDATSVAFEDLIHADDADDHVNYTRDSFADQIEGPSVSVSSSQRHRWMYFPEMLHHELLLFKNYDSDVQSAARFGIHSSFVDSTASSTVPARESLEVRVIALFADGSSGHGHCL